ncbi:unnamed protein product [Vicia faba]|uniref:Uncharacterized protein n=1 Tax=Vicia faba TaxID=3906 RepID=A0AAV0ZPW8_VICFA|nr:unnamed protein product [Vicia faba]
MEQRSHEIKGEPETTYQNKELTNNKKITDNHNYQSNIRHMKHNIIRNNQPSSADNTLTTLNYNHTQNLNEQLKENVNRKNNISDNTPFNYQARPKDNIQREPKIFFKLSTPQAIGIRETIRLKISLGPTNKTSEEIATAQKGKSRTTIITSIKTTCIRVKISITIKRESEDLVVRK